MNGNQNTDNVYCPIEQSEQFSGELAKSFTHRYEIYVIIKVILIVMQNRC